MGDHPVMKTVLKARLLSGAVLVSLKMAALCFVSCAEEPGCAAVWTMAPGEKREGDVKVRVGTVSLDSCLAEVVGVDEGIAEAVLKGVETAGTSRCRLTVSVTVAPDADPGKREIAFDVRYEYHDTATDETVEERDPAKLCVIVD